MLPGSLTIEESFVTEDDRKVGVSTISPSASLVDRF